jgi:hypothetical protein
MAEPRENFLARFRPAPPARAQPKAAAAPKKADAATFTRQPQLPQSLVALLATHPPPEPRLAWAIPGVLAFGCAATDRGQPAVWLRDHGVRVVVDVSAKHPEGRDYLSTYAGECTTACAALILLPVDSRIKLAAATHEDVVRVCRALNEIVTRVRATPDAPRKFAVHVCDGRGGGVAALIVSQLVALQFGVDIGTAANYVTTCWQEKTLSVGQRMPALIPEGEFLKRAAVTLHARLVQPPIVGREQAAWMAAACDVFARNNVADMGVAVMALHAIPARLFMPHIPFQRRPMNAVVWLKIHDPPAEGEEGTRKRAYDDGDRPLDFDDARAYRRNYERNDTDPANMWAAADSRWEDDDD